MTLGLIDADSWNLKSLESTIDKSDIKYKRFTKPENLVEVSKLILLGISAFPDFMNRLEKKNIIKVTIEKSNQNVSFLEICLGYQVFTESKVHKITKGFDLKWHQKRFFYI